MIVYDVKDFNKGMIRGCPEVLGDEALDSFDILLSHPDGWPPSDLRQGDLIHLESRAGGEYLFYKVLRRAVSARKGYAYEVIYFVKEETLL